MQIPELKNNHPRMDGEMLQLPASILNEIKSWSYVQVHPEDLRILEFVER